MRNTVLFLFMLIANIFCAQTINTKDVSVKLYFWKESLKIDNYASYKVVVDDIYTMATNKKIWGNDKDTLDILKQLGALGTEAGRANSSDYKNYSYIRNKSILALSVIGGDYARLCVFNIFKAGKDFHDLDIAINCLKAIQKMGTDESYTVFKSIRYIYDTVPRNETSLGIEYLSTFVGCVAVLSEGAPYEVLDKYEIIDALTDLANENARYRIYSQEIRKTAKETLNSILSNKKTDSK